MSDLAPFVTADELRMAAQEPSLSDDEALWLCRWASDSVRAELNQMVNVVEDDTVTLNGTGGQIVLLPEIEVRDVSAVVLGNDWLEPEVDYLWDSAGCLYRLHPSPSSAWQRFWPRRPRALVVTYDHGWAVGSVAWRAAASVALSIALRSRRNPEMLQSERIGDYSKAWIPTASRAELSEAERRMLDPLRRER